MLSIQVSLVISNLNSFPLLRPSIPFKLEWGNSFKNQTDNKALRKRTKSGNHISIKIKKYSTRRIFQQLLRLNRKSSDETFEQGRNGWCRLLFFSPFKHPLLFCHVTTVQNNFDLFFCFFITQDILFFSLC